jgi:uroporphyrinogen III methyltransferase / synthase
VFGHLAEELAGLRAAGIAAEVVPGVTTGLAAAAEAGISVTQGGQASAVALVTGRQRSDISADALDYAALAKFPGTLIFYMGVATVAEWSASLLREGKSPELPVAIVRRCSWPDQTVHRCTLGTVAEVVARLDIHPPAVIMVGEVAATGEQDK